MGLNNVRPSLPNFYGERKPKSAKFLRWGALFRNDATSRTSKTNLGAPLNFENYVLAINSLPKISQPYGRILLKVGVLVPYGSGGCTKLTHLKSKMTDSPPNFQCLNHHNSAADCSISQKFGREFDHVRADMLQTFKIRGQRPRSQRDVMYQQLNLISRERVVQTSNLVKIIPVRSATRDTCSRLKHTHRLGD